MDSNGWCGLNSIQSVGVCRQSVSARYKEQHILIMPDSGQNRWEAEDYISFVVEVPLLTGLYFQISFSIFSTIFNMCRGG
jgi:hypothetical protein